MNIMNANLIDLEPVVARDSDPSTPHPRKPHPRKPEPSRPLPGTVLPCPDFTDTSAPDVADTPTPEPSKPPSQTSRPPWTLRKLIRSCLALVGLGLGIILLWPASLGGRGLFVVVQGSSMEPSYSMGDFLYARSTNHAKLGDIVVYRVPAGQPGEGIRVVHRVVGIRPDGRYVFKGDNKKLPDDALPASGDLVARAYFNLGPLPTRVLVAAPLLMSIMASLSVGWYFWRTRTSDEPDDGTVEIESNEQEERLLISTAASAGEERSEVVLGSPPPSRRRSPLTVVALVASLLVVSTVGAFVGRPVLRGARHLLHPSSPKTSLPATPTAPTSASATDGGKLEFSRPVPAIPTNRPVPPWIQPPARQRLPTI